jgi:hypothetical protein
VTCARQRLFGANTPWKRVRLTRGLGISAASRAMELIFGAILYLVPDTGSFAQNDIFFHAVDLFTTLANQFFSVAVYLLFLLAACLVDFYRKEFNF